MAGKQKQDIKDYNRVIQDMIAGESPCLYCEEHDACNLNSKAGKGCSNWWLRYPTGGDPDAGIAEGENAQKTIPVFGVAEQ